MSIKEKILFVVCVIGLFGIGQWGGFMQGRKAGYQAGYQAGLQDGAQIICERVNAFMGSTNFIRIQPGPTNRPTNRPAMSL